MEMDGSKSLAVCKQKIRTRLLKKKLTLEKKLPSRILPGLIETMGGGLKKLSQMGVTFTKCETKAKLTIGSNVF